MDVCIGDEEFKVMDFNKELAYVMGYMMTILLKEYNISDIEGDDIKKKVVEIMRKMMELHIELKSPEDIKNKLFSEKDLFLDVSNQLYDEYLKTFNQL